MSSVLLLLALLVQGAEGQPASFREGVLLMREGRLEEAEKAFLAALAEFPAHAPSSVQLARIYEREGRNEEARKVLEEGLHHRPDGIVLLNDYGMLLLMTGDAALSKTTFEHALRVEPGNPRARMGLGLLLAESEPAVALEHLTAALEAFPNDVGAFTIAGRLAYSLNRDAEAIDLLTKAVTLEPKDVDAWLTLGRTYYRRTSNAEARNAFEEALAADPDNEDALTYLGEIALQELRFEDAVAALAKVDSPRAARDRARALVRLGKYDEAEGALESISAAEQGPREEAEALRLRGSIELERGNAEQALPVLLQSRDLDPNAVETRYLLGTVLARLGRAQESEQELAAFQRLKAFEDEKTKLELAILERPDEPEPYRALVELYLREGREDEARIYLEKALLLAPTDEALLSLQERLEAKTKKAK